MTRTVHTPLKCAVIEDEPLARSYLCRLLEDSAVVVTAEGESGTDAIRIAEDLKPDVMFLDVQMPGLSGIEAAAAIKGMRHVPLIVFVTGYSVHAVAAFEHAALDYLLKPVAPERLEATLARARERLLTPAVVSGGAGAYPSADAPLKRLPVRENYSVLLIRVEEIVCAVSREKRIYVRTPDREVRTYYTLSELETLLPAADFVRIHDSCLVRLSAIAEILFLGNHSYAVRLDDGVQLPVGRSRYRDLQRRLGIGRQFEADADA